MSYAAHVLADSISPSGHRLTTLLGTFPRFLLPEINTHRMLSRNSASSRAIPTELLIERVRDNPFIPETFNKRVKGMGVGDALDEQEMAGSRADWLHGAEAACRTAERLMKRNVDKSRANRPLEPYLWHTAIISATEWDNFFALRIHPGAQPEFQVFARMMRDAMELSQPQRLQAHQWHLPLLTDDELANLRNNGHSHVQAMKKVSAGRCARVSYDTHNRLESHAKSIARAETLMGNGHFSPFEHIARPWGPEELAAYIVRAARERERARAENEQPDARYLEAIQFTANFRGWVQMRSEIPHESNFGRAIAELAAQEGAVA